MITIIAILITWYATKVYYTRNLKLSINPLDPDMVQAECHQCAQIVVTHVDNMRSPFYCLRCV
jgi:hypothetical protein